MFPICDELELTNIHTFLQANSSFMHLWIQSRFLVRRYFIWKSTQRFAKNFMNKFNNIQFSLKHSSESLWRCQSYHISGAEMWLVLRGSSHMVCAWHPCDPQQMCCFSLPWRETHSLTHLCLLSNPTVTWANENVALSVWGNKGVWKTYWLCLEGWLPCEH